MILRSRVSEETVTVPPIPMIGVPLSSLTRVGETRAARCAVRSAPEILTDRWRSGWDLMSRHVRGEIPSGGRVPNRPATSRIADPREPAADDRPPVIPR